MMTLFDILGYWGAVSVPIGVGAGIWMRRRGLKKTIPVNLQEGERDEYLCWTENGLVPTGEYVEPGVNPVFASRQRSRVEGVRYETRRVEQS